MLKKVTPIIATILGLPGLASAQLNIKTPNSAGRFDSIGDIILNAFNIVIVIAGVIFMILLLIGGLQYLTSGGDEDNATKARKLLLNAVIGIVIIVVSWAVGNFVLRTLGIGISF